MPLFEFQCNSCNKIFEELVSSNEIPACPHCHFEKTEKIISRPCRKHSGGTSHNDFTSSSTSAGTSSGCGGCSGGSCSTCGS